MTCDDNLPRRAGENTFGSHVISIRAVAFDIEAWARAVRVELQVIAAEYDVPPSSR